MHSVICWILGTHINVFPTPSSLRLTDCGLYRLGYRKYKDTRTWQERVSNMDNRWQALLPRLVPTYLRWKYAASPSERPNESAPLDQSETYDFSIECLDMWSMQTSINVSRNSEERVAEALVACGYLGATPDQPSIAISLDTLEHFRHLRLVKASFSVEAFTKLLCYRYTVSGPWSDIFWSVASGTPSHTDPVPTPIPEGNCRRLRRVSHDSAGSQR